MPMPDTITQADIARWDQAFQLCANPQARQLCDAPQTRANFWYPGMYLAEQLQRLGCSAEIHQRVALDLAHRLTQTPDAWIPTLQILEEFRQGKFDRPASRTTQILLQHAQSRGLLPVRPIRKVPNGKRRSR